MNKVMGVVEDIAYGILDIANGITDTVEDIADIFIYGIGVSGSGSSSDSSSNTNSSSNSGSTIAPALKPIEPKQRADELAELRERMFQFYGEKEDKILKKINTSLDAFLREIKKMNYREYEGIKLHINLDAIEEKNYALKKKVNNCIGNEMRRRLVLTDPEFSKILEETDDSKRKADLENFIKCVEQEAIRVFRQELENVVKAQSSMIEEEIRKGQKKADELMNKREKDLQDILERKAGEDKALEEKQISMRYQSSLYDILLREAEE